MRKKSLKSWETNQQGKIFNSLYSDGITLSRSLFLRSQISEYYQNCRGGSFGQVEAVDVDDVAKWRQNLI